MRLIISGLKKRFADQKAQKQSSPAYGLSETIGEVPIV